MCVCVTVDSGFFHFFFEGGCLSKNNKTNGPTDEGEPEERKGPERKKKERKKIPKILKIQPDTTGENNTTTPTTFWRANPACRSPWRSWPVAAT